MPDVQIEASVLFAIGWGSLALFIIGAVVLSRARAEPIVDIDDEAVSRAETSAVHVAR